MNTFGENKSLEEWRTVIIDGIPVNYKVSNFGRVFSIKSNKILKKVEDKDGYEIVNIYYYNKSHRNHKVHRLVAQAFILNPNEYPYVNHKDEIKNNNCADNLEWCTQKYNCNYGTKIKRGSESLRKNPYLKERCLGKNPNAKGGICDGITYNCLKDISTHYNISYSTMKGWMNPNIPNKMPKLFKELGLRYINNN